MRAVVQRVIHASVSVYAPRPDGAGEDSKVVGEIGPGLCVLVGAGDRDSSTDVAYMVDKVANLRIFGDSEGKMNRSVLDVDGGVLAVSQFTLYGDTRKGRRPSFVHALEPVAARALYEEFVAGLRQAGVAHVATGVFRAMMRVSLVNDGPVTILLDSSRAF
ncbi:MAG: D-aminoacyl-tRNA deacylase [Proteobacteria bacterium]|nr:D-aminoacyl-tRNA deacylase [Pseudomonadota bacterium]